MSEFLFIIPQGWTQMPANTVPELGGIVADWIGIGNMAELSDALKARGDIPQDAFLIEARMFNGEVLVVRLG